MKCDDVPILLDNSLLPCVRDCKGDSEGESEGNNEADCKEVGEGDKKEIDGSSVDMKKGLIIS